MQGANGAKREYSRENERKEVATEEGKGRRGRKKDLEETGGQKITAW